MLSPKKREGCDILVNSVVIFRFLDGRSGLIGQNRWLVNHGLTSMGPIVAALLVLASSRPALIKLCGGEIDRRVNPESPLQPKTGKTWAVSTFTRDHTRLMVRLFDSCGSSTTPLPPSLPLSSPLPSTQVELPHYLGAYLGPRALPAATIEAIMLTVNSINTCPYCTGLHSELARMANTVIDKRSPEVVFATVFATEAGRGAKVQTRPCRQSG